jgi:hypothetical protein
MKRKRKTVTGLEVQYMSARRRRRRFGVRTEALLDTTKEVDLEARTEKCVAK